MKLEIKVNFLVFVFLNVLDEFLDFGFVFVGG